MKRYCSWPHHCGLEISKECEAFWSQCKTPYPKVKVAFVHPKGNTSFKHWAVKFRGWTTSTYSKGVRNMIEWPIHLSLLLAYAEAYCDTLQDEDIDVQYVLLNQ